MQSAMAISLEAVHDQYAEEKGQHRCCFCGNARPMITIRPVAGHDQGKQGNQATDDQPGIVIQRGQVATQGTQQRVEYKIANAERDTLVIAHFPLKAD